MSVREGQRVTKVGDTEGEVMGYRKRQDRSGERGTEGKTGGGRWASPRESMTLRVWDRVTVYGRRWCVKEETCTQRVCESKFQSFLSSLRQEEQRAEDRGTAKGERRQGGREAEKLCERSVPRRTMRSEEGKRRRCFV